MTLKSFKFSVKKKLIKKSKELTILQSTLAMAKFLCKYTTCSEVVPRLFISCFNTDLVLGLVFLCGSAQSFYPFNSKVLREAVVEDTDSSEVQQDEVEDAWIPNVSESPNDQNGTNVVVVDNEIFTEMPADLSEKLPIKKFHLIKWTNTALHKLFVTVGTSLKKIFVAFSKIFGPFFQIFFSLAQVFFKDILMEIFASMENNIKSRASTITTIAPTTTTEPNWWPWG